MATSLVPGNRTHLMTFKEKVYKKCVESVNDKITLMQTVLNDLTVGAENDSKSSAGDKHETARAMMQMEHEKISRQLDEMLLQKSVLERMDFPKQVPVVTLGSLVKTDTIFLFVSIALGKIMVDGISVIALSPQSPLGEKLMGLHTGDDAEMNGVSYTIEKIL
ncbi:MAG: hypothetical protein NT126_01915 [Bacteroidetes bacterium]|nr:hypothetical protein [Bacteroidota bacterium]